MSILVIAEHDGSALKTSTLHTITAAAAIGGDIHVLVASAPGAAPATQAAQVSGVSKVLHAAAAHLAHGLAEDLAPLVVSLAPGYGHILAPATTFGKNLLPRVAALLDVAQVSDVTAIESADTFMRLVYAGNVFATVQSTDTIKVLTVRTTAFEAARLGGAASIEAVAAGEPAGQARLISRELSVSNRPELGNAKVVVSGGRALGSSATFQSLLAPLADKLGAALGASRAAVDAAYVANDCQVGQTGQIVAPQLYIAVGISGAIQHVAGMKDSRVIVAINKDPEAPIFQVADYGLVSDLFELVPELTALL